MSTGVGGAAAVVAAGGGFPPSTMASWGSEAGTGGGGGSWTLALELLAFDDSLCSGIEMDGWVKGCVSVAVTRSCLSVAAMCA